MKTFDIKADLAGRELSKQIEILWISGSTCGNAKKIAKVLDITEAEVLKSVPAKYEYLNCETYNPYAK